MGLRVLPALFAISVGPCATAPQLMMSTARSPGTEVSISMRQEKNGNVEMTVRAEHLPPPERLASGLKTYVVWITPKGSEHPYNAGMLRATVSQQGKLQVLTSQTSFIVSVTAEERGDVLTPSSNLVAEGMAEWKKENTSTRLKTGEQVSPGNEQAGLTE